MSVMKSPFFRPSANESVDVETPGGTRSRVARPKKRIEEHKSTILGCTANLINAIIGSGIVGIPYAILQAGFVSGIILIIFCAFLTDKSLRLLIATAKHANVPSYETLAEAAFGKWGFGFIAINMFIMAYGAMLSYLMIVKDTFSVALGIDPGNLGMKRAILFVISFLIIVPLSCQRDMADLAKTSRISVVIDTLLVMVVAYKSPVSLDRLEVLARDTDWLTTGFWIHTDTVFVGLGVLSFAFVCQHSAFIIAGSLDNPTVARWSRVTKIALCLCASLALLCGTTGYLGFLDNTVGNIINNLLVKDFMSNVARGMLGTTMLFVYPMESFVARHVLVVLLFEGRRAHEGDDASILARRDRRVALTMALYISALLPAILFEDLGNVLAATGAVGGSCLSYIGPGAMYLGVHGDQFIYLIEKKTWWNRYVKDDPGGIHTKRQSNKQSNRKSETAALLESGAPKASISSAEVEVDEDEDEEQSCCRKILQALTWYILGMPLWVYIARFGEQGMVKHQEDMALKSPHPMRIGNVAPGTPQTSRSTSRQSTGNIPENLSHLAMSQSFREGDLNQQHSVFDRAGAVSLLSGSQQQMSALHPTDKSSFRSYQQAASGGSMMTSSLNQQIGAKLLANKREEQKVAAEKDPQKAPPTLYDFVFAVFFMIFGVLALVAGLVSMAIRND